MSVHHDISKHSNDQHERVRIFSELDQKREQLIEQALLKCKEEKTFEQELIEINKLTDEINDLARKGIVPQRKNVTKEMVEEYCKR
ncbi:YpbS family protein [Bacillus sp. Marseille-Q3570]|uniref:YpbS family protein n=1 Tax=Bacillus sp. Marseille-Q3570 TaxID=2963522 RepID=UPI0021B777D4|nr:YpbS family protein [Bacillus sp. Marseille-Q3570]